MESPLAKHDQARSDDLNHVRSLLHESRGLLAQEEKHARSLDDIADDQREKITDLEQEKLEALRVAHDATKAKLELERRLEALSTG